MSQNGILHQHLESVSTQAARIRQAADSTVSGTDRESESTGDSDSKLAELRSVVSYLRKENRQDKDEVEKIEQRRCSRRVRVVSSKPM